MKHWAASGVRITAGTSRRLRLFAVTQIAASFVLLAGAGMLLTTLISMQRVATGIETGRVLALNVPEISAGRTKGQTLTFYQEIVRQVQQLPGVERVAIGATVPWRGGGGGMNAQFSIEGYDKAQGEEDPRGRPRTVSNGFFAAMGLRLLAGRDFQDSDRPDGEQLAIVSQSVAQRMFGSVDAAVNRRLMWTEYNLVQFGGISPEPRRIVGVVADFDDENFVPGPAMSVYHPLGQFFGFGGRLFVRTRQEDPYALVPSITRIIRQMSADQPIERPTTLADVRAEVLAPDRLNAMLFGGFALVALTIAVVGVAGVLAFSVSARTREFGIRLAIGSAPRHVLTRVLGEGAVIAAVGIIAGAIAGVALAQVAGSFIAGVRIPGIVPIVGAASLLVITAILASLLPAARASRVDIVQALRSE